MQTLQQEHPQSGGNFDLKHVPVDLLGAPKSSATSLTISDLEAFRVSRAALSASKHGLEAILQSESASVSDHSFRLFMRWPR
jgi:hypothetical protein